MNLDDDDSVFEQALRADLPTSAEQNRIRQRMLAAGIAAGTALGTTNVAAAAQASFSASALSKLSALSWPAKLGLTAALAAPLAGVALPVAYQPVPAAELVREVRSSAASMRTQLVAKTALAPANLPSVDLPQIAPPSPGVELQPAQARIAAAASPAVALPTPASATPASATPASATPASATPASATLASATPAAANDGPRAADSAVAAFGSVTHDTFASKADELHNASTLAAETQLLDRAFSALAAGDRSTAATLVAEHARRFPNGLLRQERERARARLAPNSKGE